MIADSPSTAAPPIVSPSACLPSVSAALARLKPGQRHALPCPPGSGDAFWLAQLAIQATAQAAAQATAQTTQAQRPVIVLCADPQAAQRLGEEIALFAPGLRVRQLPDWETLPYDSFSPHHDLISERLRTLHALINGAVDVLTVPVTTALYRLGPPGFLAAHTFAFKQGDRLDAQALRQQLTLANYSHVTQVNAPGEFCVRGGLIDLFPMGSVVPYRIDLFDDEIESIRCFDVDTQRSLYPVKEVQLLPGREFPMDEAARKRFRARFREVFEGDPSRALPYKDIGNGIAFSGVEYYLPLFFEQTATLFDYLPEQAILVTLGQPDEAIGHFDQDTRSRYAFLKNDAQRPVLAPEALFLDSEQFHLHLKNFARIALNTDGQREPHPDIVAAPDVSVQRVNSRREQDPLQRLRRVISHEQNSGLWQVTLCAHSAGRRETLLQMLNEHRLVPDTGAEHLAQALQQNAPFKLVVTPLQTGFGLPATGQLLLTENDLYPDQLPASRRSRRAQQARSDVDAMIRDLSELRPGDPVVHVEHGIGRYHGLIEMDVGEGAMEFLHLEYASGSTLYVPVSQLHVIARYSGADPEHAPLHQLGSGQWDKARRKAARQVRDAAAELLALYALRASRSGHVFALEGSDYQSFAAGFGFEETPDQAAAIEAVIHDMGSPQPMDRLVCGDVGFGKTEVALRAAFIAVSNHQQVALLCPTTLLAEQHAQTFIDRFADWPVKVALLSRFRSAKEAAATLQGLADGTVDIVIGTHKLLSKDVRFKQLGLVIIDEEHRFGVRQKEALKTLRAQVDVLTLTATPIPRTLGMSLEGIRDFSVIATAPQKRLAIKTFVRREDNSTLREALLRELKRGGQVYFLHNEVETIGHRFERLSELVPEARIGVAHGQMGERELERVMKDFYQQRTNVLLCTTIIETGIDVPTANTILIHRADRLGLAQLHQLRGRVGRSHHQAYAYLLTPGIDAMTANAKKRLEAIQSMEELGAGFYLAMHDLEIRGAGAVLGDAQSGNIQDVGFTLYADMLNTAVRALKAGEEPDLLSPLQNTCEINLHAPALLPSDYCPDVHARLGFYKRLSHAQDADALLAIQEALIDRYGVLPPAAKNLMLTHQLRIQAQDLGIQKIDASDSQALIKFSANTRVDPARLIQMLQTQPHIKLTGPDRLRIALPHDKKADKTADNNPDKTADAAASATAIHKRVQTLGQILKNLH